MKLSREKLKNMTREDKERLFDLLQERKRREKEKRDVYKPNAGQLPVHLSDKRERFGLSGNGCFAKGTQVRMFDGSVKTVEDVRINDELLGPDGAKRLVHTLYRGKQQMYEIAPTDNSGDPYTVNEDHILSLQCCTDDPSRGYKKGQVVNVKVKDYLSWSDRKKRIHYGYRATAAYQEKTLGRIPCKVPHKMLSSTKIQREHRRYKIKVTKKEVNDFFGFGVDKDHLFCLKDFTVTHNSGKTTLAANEALWFAQGYNPVTKQITKVPSRTVIVLPDPAKVEDLWLPEIRKWSNLKDVQLLKNGKPYINELLFPSGSRISFMFHQQDPLTFEGIELDNLIIDEPCGEHIYTALKRGQRKKNSNPKILMIGTPIAAGWLRRKIFEPWERGERPDVEFFRFSTDVNKENLADGYIENFFGNLSEKEKRIRQDGEWFELDGLALAHLFKEDKHVVDYRDLEWQMDSWPCVISIDPHTSKPHHAVLMGCDPNGNYVVLDEYRSTSVASKFAAELKERGWYKFNVINITFDNAGQAKHTSGEGFHPFGDRFNHYQRAQSLPAARPTTFKQKSDDDFIERIRNALAPAPGMPQLYISSNCCGTISNIRHVSWKKVRLHDMNQPKLDIAEKDYLAALKYALALNLRFDSGKRQKVYRMKKMPTGYVGDRGADHKRSKEIKAFNTKIKNYLRGKR